jgi:hypothetical protein
VLDAHRLRLLRGEIVISPDLAATSPRPRSHFPPPRRPLCPGDHAHHDRLRRRDAGAPKAGANPRPPTRPDAPAGAARAPCARPVCVSHADVLTPASGGVRTVQTSEPGLTLTLTLTHGADLGARAARRGAAHALRHILALDGAPPSRHISPHLATSRHISPHLPTSRHIAPHLAISRHIARLSEGPTLNPRPASQPLTPSPPLPPSAPVSGPR